MMQVFINLFSNAIKFSPAQGEVIVTIEDAVLPGQRPAIHCSVADEGAGIPDGELEAIFEKFTQSSKTDKGAGGSGLGLAICREIVHLHQGKIWASNTASGGGMFHIVVPRDLAPHGGEPAARHQSRSPGQLELSANPLN